MTTAATEEVGQCEQCEAPNATYKITRFEDYGDTYDTVIEKVCHQCYWYHRLEQRVDTLAERVAELENKRT